MVTTLVTEHLPSSLRVPGPFLTYGTDSLETKTPVRHLMHRELPEGGFYPVSLLDRFPFLRFLVLYPVSWFLQGGGS